MPMAAETAGRQAVCRGCCGLGLTCCCCRGGAGALVRVRAPHMCRPHLRLRPCACRAALLSLGIGALAVRRWLPLVHRAFCEAQAAPAFSADWEEKSHRRWPQPVFQGVCALLQLRSCMPRPSTRLASGGKFALSFCLKCKCNHLSAALLGQGGSQVGDIAQMADESLRGIKCLQLLNWQLLHSAIEVCPLTCAAQPVHLRCSWRLSGANNNSLIIRILASVCREV